MVDSHQGSRYDADPGQGAGQGEISHPQVRNRVSVSLKRAKQSREWTGRGGRGLLCETASRRNRVERVEERGGKCGGCTSPDKSIGIYSTVTAGVQAAVPERDQGPAQAGGTRAMEMKMKKRPNSNKTREDQSGIACRGNFMSGLKWTRRRGRLSNADWSSSHLFSSLFWKLFELQSFKPSGYL